MDGQGSVRAHVVVSGRVQGVSFRWYMQQKAHELGLSGWVRNLWDGRVEAVIEGEEIAVHQILRWCRSGPPMAQVDDVQVTRESPRGDLSGFHIRQAV